MALFEGGMKVRVDSSRFVNLFYDGGLWRVVMSNQPLVGYHSVPKPEGAREILLPNAVDGNRLYFKMAKGELCQAERSLRQVKSEKSNPYLGCQELRIAELPKPYTHMCGVIEAAHLGRLAERNHRIVVNFFRGWPRHANKAYYFEIPSGAERVMTVFPVYNREVQIALLGQSTLETRVQGLANSWK
jgi:hypothetical protein